MTDSRLTYLVAEGLLGQALAHIGGARRQLTLSERVLKLELTSVTSAKDICATESAQLLATRDLSAGDRVRCLVVEAAGQLRLGSDTSGLATFKKAVAHADKLGGDVACFARVSQLQALTSWIGPEAASVEIAAVRRLVTRAGRPEFTIRFHLALAEIAAKQSLLRKAERQLAIVADLLSSFPNRFLETEHAIRLGATRALASDPKGAAEFAERAIELAIVCGAPTLEVVARSNLAHALLALGQLRLCHQELSKALELCRSNGSAELGILDGFLQFALASEDQRLASEVADSTYEHSVAIDNGHSYYGLWHLLTRVKLLYRTGQADAGVAIAMDAIPRIERMADRNLLERMQLLAAEGLGRIGRAGDGARLMANAVSANPDPPLEMMAEAARVAGRLTALDDPLAAAGHFGRAARILHAVGNLTASAEITRDSRETTQADTAGAARLRPPAAALIERVAALIELAAHPPLLAAETLSLLADTHSALHARIVESGPDGSTLVGEMEPAEDAPAWLDSHPDLVTMQFGPHRDRPFTILALPRPTATARATLLAVERLVHTALTLARARQQERELTALWPEPSPEQQLGLVCASERMMELVKSVRRVATSNVTVLITGETGVGKELFARALHQASPRSDRVFLPFNCTTVPRDIIDSQLFGHRRGAFTGAQDDSPGLIRAAAGGTLFLDEIGELSPETQPKLLRFLETGEILPLGETRPQLVDVRVVAATNANLEQLVADGRFREDLYYRLNVIPLHVPPLRERREEIPLLVDHFIDKFSHELQKPLLRVSEETLEYLVLYKWPGNVRQLGNEVRRMVAMAEAGAVLMPEHLSAAIAASRRTVPADQRVLEPTELVMRLDQPLAAATEHLERAAILRALKLSDGRVDDAAKLLGLSRKGLYLKRQRLGIE
jgi:DNA-binding NtrC family response regulator/tetratricopeptide (TPR) repeat protein